MIRSLMFFTVSERHFQKGLPENGQPYKNWSDLAFGFVQYQQYICQIPCVSPELLLKVPNTMLIFDKSKSQIVPISI